MSTHGDMSHITDCLPLRNMTGSPAPAPSASGLPSLDPIIYNWAAFQSDQVHIYLLAPVGRPVGRSVGHVFANPSLSVGGSMIFELDRRGLRKLRNRSLNMAEEQNQKSLTAVAVSPPPPTDSATRLMAAPRVGRPVPDGGEGGTVGGCDGGGGGGNEPNAGYADCGARHEVSLGEYNVCVQVGGHASIAQQSQGEHRLEMLARGLAHCDESLQFDSQCWRCCYPQPHLRRIWSLKPGRACCHSP